MPDSLALAPPRERLVQLPDGEIALLELGDPAAPAGILFLHANGFNALTYRSILAPLADRVRVVAADLRGHGASRLPARPSGRRNWNDMVGDLVALLDRLDGPPLVLSGHSLGGVLSLISAARRPARVKRLVLFDPVILPLKTLRWSRLPVISPMLWRKSPLVQGALRRRAQFDSKAAAVAAYTGRGAFKTWPEAVLADYVEAGFVARADGTVALACSPAWEASNFMAQGNDPWGALRRYPGPVEIYLAAKGSACDLGPLEPLRHRHPLLRVETVPGTSHFLPMERPELVREALLRAVTV